ncbi:MAG TPA: hypothetical protein VHV29_01165 [Terriglobales bacterium]|jgi:hypothetical protein|nr:hypothetical protein [Terriglobales bacterium]
MSAGLKLAKVCGAVILSIAVLCAGSASAADGVQTHSHKKIKKPQAPPLPSGPTGPVQQMPLDSIAAVPPQVSFANNQLTIVAPNSTLADILKAVRKQTGAEIDVPAAPDRVVTHLGPGPARDVIADLLNGSRFNYVLLGSPGDDTVLTRVVLVPKSGPESITPAPAATPGTEQAAAQSGDAAQPEQDASQDGEEQQAQDSGTDDSDQQSADADQDQQAQQQQDQQQGIKTPQQMLQEMQQRQMQLQQQQQQSGQPVNPGLAPRGPQQYPQQQQQQ